MKKILVISDNDLLNQLYLINLEIYIGASVTIVKDLASAEKALKNLKNFDLIVAMAMLNEHDMGTMCVRVLKEMQLATPLVLIGATSKELENVVTIPSSYNLQNLLRAVAAKLGVTAKQMAEVEVPKYYPISISYLSHVPNTPCDLFLQVNAGKGQFDYVICAKKDSSISSIVTKLHNEGVTKLFVNAHDRLSMVNKISQEMSLLIGATANASTSAKTSAVSEGFAFAATLVDSAEVVQEVVDIANTCSKVMDKVVTEIAGMKSLVQMLVNNQEGYIYTHSMLVAYVSRHIVKNVTWGGDSHIERINFMIFFHDIFLVPIYENHPEARAEEELLFGDTLSDSEKEILLNHARLAGEQITKYKKCPSGIDLLIKQHHGTSNGIGFATDFSDNISPLSKVFIISEAFVELYLKEKQKDPNYKINLKEFVGILHAKFPKHTYKKIIDPLLTLRI